MLLSIDVVKVHLFRLSLLSLPPALGCEQYITSITRWHSHPGVLPRLNRIRSS